MYNEDTTLKDVYILNCLYFERWWVRNTSCVGDLRGWDWRYQWRYGVSQSQYSCCRLLRNRPGSRHPGLCIFSQQVKSSPMIFFNWYYLFSACYHSLVEKQIFFWKMCNFYLSQIFTIANKTYLLYFVHYFICNLCKINSYILFFKEQYFFISDICIDINWNWLCWPWFFFLKIVTLFLFFI